MIILNLLFSCKTCFHISFILFPTITLPLYPLSDTITGFTGAVMTGEGAALLIGIRLLNKNHPWLTPWNRIFCVLDIIIGSFFLASVWIESTTLTSCIFIILMCLAILSHGYREWAFVKSLPNAFCANRPLFAVNTLKLFCLIFITVLRLL
jgi:hypothetical protein